jgi:quercetin dioxygenase-like cupin family protein
MFRTIATIALLALLGSAIPSFAQDVPIKRIPLQKYDVPGANYETIMGIAQIAPNVLIGKHNHPGTEGGYILEGTLTLFVDGQPPKDLKPGDSYNIGPGVAHDAKSGPSGAKVLAVYTVEKGKPLASPVK